MKNKKDILEAMRVGGKGKSRLAKRDPSATDGPGDKETARALVEKAVAEMSDYQYKLYAEAKTSVLIVFQALDTGGKDGVIRNVFGPLNPQGVAVTSFKQPSTLEKSHDYLWRIHSAVPAKGMIRVFNRSHYEDVLVYKVHNLLPDEIIKQRYRQINDFEQFLTENGVVILKFFLHISKGEQKERLQARLDNPDKRWKFELSDLKERQYWDAYQEAFADAIDACSTDDAPWYVIPSDRKWYRDWAVSEIIRQRLEKLNPQLPKPQEGIADIVVE